MTRTHALLAAVLLLPALALAAPEPNKKYVEANAALGKPKAGEKRVIFIGSSSVEGWKLDKEFPKRDFVNRGISGENTRQMLARFEQDVIALGPTVVLIHIGGANDLGAIKTAETIDNLGQMIRAAKKAGATPILLSPTPSRGDHLKNRPVAKVQALRDEMQKLATDEKVAWVDVYSLVADAKGELKEEITRDGLHLKAAGYALLRAAVTTAIDDALAGKKPNAKAKDTK